MTILFATAHDEATRANLAVARLIRRDGDVVMFENEANRAVLLQALATPPTIRAIFSMSHGTKDGTIGNDGHVALTSLDSSALVDFHVFAWACHTGSRVGALLSQTGTTWWGYDSAITAPSERAEFISVFQKIFDVIRDCFSNANDAKSVDQALERIKAECDGATWQFDKLDASLDPEGLSLYSCCNQIWQRLSVWRAMCTLPQRHFDAPPPYIDL